MKKILKNAAIIFLFAGIFYGLDFLESKYTAEAVFRVSIAYPFLNFIIVVFGPVIGGLAGILGNCLMQLGKVSPNWISIICSAVYCVGLGILTRSIDITNGFFMRKEVLQYNRSQAIQCILTEMILCPILSVLLLKADFLSVLNQGFWRSLTRILSCLFLTTLFLSLYARTRMSEANFYLN